MANAVCAGFKSPVGVWRACIRLAAKHMIRFLPFLHWGKGARARGIKGAYNICLTRGRTG